MKKRDILKELNREFDELTPDASEELINALITATPPEEKRRKRKSSFHPWQRITAAVAAIAITAGLAAGVIALLPPPIDPSYHANYTYISLSINPAVSVIADSDGNVTGVTTKNRDAEVLLAGTDKAALIGQDYNAVVTYLTEEAVALGYVASAGGITVSAINCGGRESTDRVVLDVKADAESVLAASGVTATVTVSAYVFDDVFAEAGRLAALRGDEDLEDILEILAGEDDYIERLGGELGSLFGSDADSVAENLYRMELLEEYFDMLEDGYEFLFELAEFNEELIEEEEVAAAFAKASGGFASPDGWWLTWYVSEYSDSEELTELAEEFAELFEDFDDYSFAGLAPEAEDGSPNRGASAKLAEYLAAVGDEEMLEELEDYIDDLDDLLDDLDTNDYERVTALYADISRRLGSGWEEFVAARGVVSDVGDYLIKTQANIRAIYDALRSSGI